MPLNKPSDPSAVVRALVERLDAEDWEGAADLHSPAFLELSARRLLRSAETDPRRLSVDSLLAAHPSVARDVAEEQIREANRMGPDKAFFRDLYGIETLEEARRLDPREMFARQLQGRDHRWRHRLHISELLSRHPEHRDALEAHLAGVPSQWSGAVAGHVTYHDRAYVVFGLRESARTGAEDIAPPSVVLVETDQGWRVSSDIFPRHITLFGPVRVKDDQGNWIVLN